MVRDMVRRTTRIPRDLNDRMEAYVMQSSYPSANQFIIEAIAEKISRSR